MNKQTKQVNSRIKKIVQPNGLTENNGNNKYYFTSLSFDLKTYDCVSAKLWFDLVQIWSSSLRKIVMRFGSRFILYESKLWC